MNGKLMLLSLLSMFNVALLPIYDVWDGPFPEDPVYTSLDVVFGLLIGQTKMLKRSGLFLC